MAVLCAIILSVLLATPPCMCGQYTIECRVCHMMDWVDIFQAPTNGMEIIMHIHTTTRRNHHDDATTTTTQCPLLLLAATNCFVGSWCLRRKTCCNAILK